MNINKKIPVTIITGFLGSGKTTFLNHLISAYPNTKFAIIENEFGDISVDQDLIVNSDGDIFELSNGCICCSLNTELGELLQKLVNGPYEFDHLLIETTGIAEPDSIASAFFGPGKESTFQLNGTICLTDAEAILMNLNQRGEAVKQVAFSDLIVINKTDLICSHNLDKVRSAISGYNPVAEIVECSYGNIDREVLSLNAYESERIERYFMTPRKHHHDDFISHSFVFSEALDPLKFEHWMNMLLFLSGYQIFRIKGILNMAGMDHKVVFQSVRSRSKLEPGNRWEDEEKRVSKIVFIGYNIKKESLEKGIKGCFKVS